MYVRGLQPLKIFIYLTGITEVVNALLSSLDSLPDDAIRVNHAYERIPLPRTNSSHSILANKESLEEDSIRWLQEYNNESDFVSIRYHMNGPFVESSRRQLWEYDNESDPVNDPFHIDFHGYRNSSVNVTQWMVDLLKGIYDVRLGEGVSHPLCFNEILMKSAQDHIFDIVDQELILSHIGSDGSCSGERITRDGYNYENYGATITRTKCTTVECAIVNRPLYFTKKGNFKHFGIAREEYPELEGDPRWYWIFGESDEEHCMGTTATTLEWPVGTPTLPPEPPAPPRPPIDPDDGGHLIDDRMIALPSLMNAERKHYGLNDFCFNKKLILAAQAHSQDMVDNDFMGHTGSDGSGPVLRAITQGYNAPQFISENVAGPGMPSIRAAMYTWMASSGDHAWNILHPDGRHIGIAYDEGKKIFTAVFGNDFDGSEPCIDSVYYQSAKSYETSDSEWESYACSLCLAQRPANEFGIMGCGFGRERYLQDHIGLDDYERRLQ